MRWSDRLGKAQRIVVVIALGLALGVVGSYLVNLGNTVRAGWYAYAPLSQAVYPPRTGCKQPVRTARPAEQWSAPVAPTPTTLERINTDVAAILM